MRFTQFYTYTRWLFFQLPQIYNAGSINSPKFCESELDALVSLRLATTAFGWKTDFCARVKGHEAI